MFKLYAYQHMLWTFCPNSQFYFFNCVPTNLYSRVIDQRFLGHARINEFHCLCLILIIITNARNNLSYTYHRKLEITYCKYFDFDFIFIEVKEWSVKLKCVNPSS